jgi:hypothetical protein
MMGLRNASTMEEQCRVIEMLGGTFVQDYSVWMPEAHHDWLAKLHSKLVNVVGKL